MRVNIERLNNDFQERLRFTVIIWFLRFLFDVGKHLHNTNSCRDSSVVRDIMYRGTC